MSEISAAHVKELRQRTGAGMMDCKKALAEADGDMEAAIQWLRAKGLSAAAKKSGRIAAEGLVGVATQGNAGVVVEVNSETDFVARNEQFQALAAGIAAVALAQGGDYDATVAAEFPGGSGSVGARLVEAVAAIGENVQFRRSAGLQVDPGVIAAYVHAAAAPNLGRIGVLVALESAGDPEKLAALGKQLAMHVAAASPQAVTSGDLDPAVIAAERAVYATQAAESGKPPEIAEKMVEGRLRKFFAEATLLGQIFVIDNETPVAKVIENAAADVGAPVTVKGFVRFALGEGIDKKETDFAAEVAAASGT